MPLLLDLLPLGHTLEEDEYVAAVCYEGETVPATVDLGGVATGTALLLAGLVHIGPLLDGLVAGLPVPLGGEALPMPAVVGGFVYPTAALGGSVALAPLVQGQVTTLLLAGAVRGLVRLSGAVSGPLLLGGVAGQPTVQGEVLSRCE